MHKPERDDHGNYLSRGKFDFEIVSEYCFPILGLVGFLLQLSDALAAREASFGKHWGTVRGTVRFNGAAVLGMTLTSIPCTSRGGMIRVTVFHGEKSASRLYPSIAVPFSRFGGRRDYWFRKGGIRFC